MSGPGGLGFGYALSVFDAGGAMVLSSRDDDVLDLIGRHHVNVLVGSPHSIAVLLERRPAGAPRLASLERIVVSGSRLTPDLLRLASERLCANVACMYGSTEAGPLAAGTASALPDVDGATGFVLPGVEIQAVDERDVVLAAGEIGHLRIRARGLAREYYEDPAATALAFRDGWFYPNDLGTVTRDGVLVITGRADDLINVGGSKFAPESIERVLLRVRGVREAAAFGVPDRFGKHVMHAAIVADGEVDVATIQEAFRAERGVPAPSVVLRVPRLPRNANGKVQRAELVRFVRSR